MPIDKDLKRLVRDRMARTGERYTVALTEVTGASTSASTRSRRRPEESWIGQLADPERNQDAFASLKALPAVDLRPLAIAGTRHDHPKARRRSCQLLDDLALTPESIAALEVCAVDEDPSVRAAALHTLSCQRCKPDGVCLDQRAIAERAAADRSAKIRVGVAMELSWNPERSDDWAVAMATRFLSDRSAKVRRHAEIALERIQRQQRTNEQRQELPEPLRAKTERHPGKWVAIEDGNIVATDPAPTWIRRHRRARLYFVAPRND